MPTATTAAAETAPGVQSVDRALTILEHPRPARRGRGHRARRRAGRPQVHRVPAGGGAGGARAGRAERGPRQVPARHRRAAAGRRHDGPARPGAGGPAGLPQARGRHGRDGQHRGALGPLGALHGPGRRLVGAPAAQLGGAAHPAARHLNGKVLLSGLDATSSTAGCRGCRVHRRHRSPARPAATRAGRGPRAGVRHGDRRARDRADRGRGADPQRARRHDRLA